MITSLTTQRGATATAAASISFLQFSFKTNCLTANYLLPPPPAAAAAAAAVGRDTNFQDLCFSLSFLKLTPKCRNSSKRREGERDSFEFSRNEVIKNPPTLLRLQTSTPAFVESAVAAFTTNVSTRGWWWQKKNVVVAQ